MPKRTDWAPTHAVVEPADKRYVSVMVGSARALAQSSLLVATCGLICSALSACGQMSPPEDPAPDADAHIAADLTDFVSAALDGSVVSCSEEVCEGTDSRVPRREFLRFLLLSMDVYFYSYRCRNPEGTCPDVLDLMCESTRRVTESDPSGPGLRGLYLRWDNDEQCVRYMPLEDFGTRPTVAPWSCGDVETALYVFAISGGSLLYPEGDSVGFWQSSGGQHSSPVFEYCHVPIDETEDAELRGRVFGELLEAAWSRGDADELLELLQNLSAFDLAGGDVLSWYGENSDRLSIGENGLLELLE